VMKPPSMAEIRRDEQKQFKQLLSDEKIKEIIRQDDALNTSKWIRPILELLRKHDWVPLRLVGEALGAHASINYKTTITLRNRKLIETKRQMYHHVNNALWLKITPEGRRMIQPAKKTR